MKYPCRARCIRAGSLTGLSIDKVYTIVGENPVDETNFLVEEERTGKHISWLKNRFQILKVIKNIPQEEV